jgi:hypothetical protein
MRDAGLDRFGKEGLQAPPRSSGQRPHAICKELPPGGDALGRQWFALTRVPHVRLNETLLGRGSRGPGLRELVSEFAELRTVEIREAGARDGNGVVERMLVILPATSPLGDNTAADASVNTASAIARRVDSRLATAGVGSVTTGGGGSRPAASGARAG